MNISEKILDDLKKTGSVTISGFGRFYLENSTAELIEEQNTILPPGKHIVFSSDFQAVNPNFLQANPSENLPGISESELRSQTDYWKKLISEGKEFEIPDLGKFLVIHDELVFRGRKISQDNPDFYGLEKIHLKDIKNPQHNKKSYKTSRNAIIIGGILAAASLGAAAFLGKGVLFGKPTFDGKKLAASVPQDKKDSVPITAPQQEITPVDTAKIAHTALPTPQKSAHKKPAVAKKKWSGRKYYKKNYKWRKQRRHRSH